MLWRIGGLRVITRQTSRALAGVALAAPLSITPVSLGIEAAAQVAPEVTWRIKSEGWAPSRTKTYTWVCLYREETGKWFSQGPWRATLLTSGEQTCSDLVAADIALRTLYVPIRHFTRGREANGAADAHCPRAQRFTPPATERVQYNACMSSFFDKNGEYRVFNQARMLDLLKISGALTVLEQESARVQEQKKIDDAVAYRAAFLGATTMEAIRAFETRYAREDPDALIPELQARKRTLQREELARAETAAQLSDFLKRYNENDPDNLRPEAQRRLASAIAAESARKKSQARADALASLERGIAWCKRYSVAAQQAIQRENRIAQISGYQSTAVLREAGSILALCETKLPADFARYRQQGGKKALTAIQ